MRLLSAILYFLLCSLKSFGDSPEVEKALGYIENQRESVYRYGVDVVYESLDRDVAIGLVEIVSGDFSLRQMKAASYNLQIAACLGRGDFFREGLLEAAESTEKRTDLSLFDKINKLRFIYMAVSSFGHEESIDFIEKRITGEAFDGKLEVAFPDLPGSYPASMSSAALSSVGALGEAVAYEYLNNLDLGAEFMDNEAMVSAYNAVLTVRDHRVRRFARIREERERFLGSSGLSNEFVSVSEKPMAVAVEVEAEHEDGVATSIASDWLAPEVREER